MTSKFRRFDITLLVVLYLLLPREVYAERCEDPDKLRFIVNAPSAILYDQKNSGLKDYLEEAIGKRITFTDVSSYSQLALALRSGKVDFAIVGVKTYIQTKQHNPNIEAFAAYHMNAGPTQPEGVGYRSILLVDSHRHFNSLSSLSESRLALVDPGSTSGFLVPNVLFSDEVKRPLNLYFHRILMSGNHRVSIKSLTKGKVDAIFISSTVFDAMISSGEINQNDFTVLWSSTSLPRAPFVYRKQLCTQLKEKIANAFLEAHLHPDAKAWLEAVNAFKIGRIEDKDYDVVRRIIKRMHNE